MLWTPPMVDNDEVLDNPATDLERRKALLLELDQTNIRYGTYAQYCRRFFDWIETLHPPDKRVTVLEIGSGSGGLAREIVRGAQDRWDIEYSLMDQDADILTWAQSRLAKDDVECRVFASGTDHLAQFADRGFDVIISLHVIHHIHPLSSVQKMFHDAVRVARLGFFHVDFTRRWGNVTMAKVVNTLYGLSTDLKEDGVKSVRRAYTAREIARCLEPAPDGYEVRVRELFPFPHMVITGRERP